MSVEGIIDIASIAAFHGALVRVVRQHAGSLVLVDLDAVVAIDDSALGVILGAAAAARESGGDIELVCNNEDVRTHLVRSRLDRAIPIRSTITTTHR